MILEQFYLGCLAHASYFIADPDSGSAAVIDPRRDVSEYLERATKLGVEIRHVLLTHFHADFLAGHLELREATGAEIRLGARAEAEYAFTPMATGDRLDLGAVRLEILETPGHTPEAISILVYDLAVSDRVPHAVLTGDTLFVGDVGRPDLMASEGVTAEELAGWLYDSLHGKLLELPDETLVYPAHGAGSLCGKSLGTETVSTIGEQRRYNYALQPMTREEFIRIVTADQPDSPAYFSHDAKLNKQERATLEEALGRSLDPLGLDEALRLAGEGAQVLDVREPADFQGAHLKGAVNIGLSGKFASWAGTLLDPERPIVLVAEPGRESEAAMRLGRIGFDGVAGYLDGGMAALETRPDLVAKTARVTAGALKDMRAAGEEVVILDVRAPAEWREGRIRGSVNVPLNQLPGRLDELDRGAPLVVHCATGYRSAIGVSLLLREGFDRASDLVGGLAAWTAASGPVEEGAGS